MGWISCEQVVWVEFIATEAKGFACESGEQLIKSSRILPNWHVILMGVTAAQPINIHKLMMMDPSFTWDML